MWTLENDSFNLKNIKSDTPTTHVSYCISMQQHTYLGHFPGCIFKSYENQINYSSKMLKPYFLTYLSYFLLTSTVAGSIWPSVLLKSFIEDAVEKAGDDHSTLGTLKDSLIKLKEWDPVDSPKRIKEDIGHNASVKTQQGVEQAKRTVENVMEATPNTAIKDVNLCIMSLGISVSGWCQLLGFSTAYGMGVWVTCFSGCVLGKCLPKHQSTMVMNKMNMVYFRAMGCCVVATLLGFVVSQGITRGCLSNKMEMFQGFNLVFALVKILAYLIFLEPRATKFISQLRMKGTSETNSVAAEKLKKINAYSSILNVSTMVALTWHLAYMSQLLQARH